MTLDEAIKHAEEVVVENLEKTKGRNASDPIAINCFECAEEHRQLAEWLKELKQLRDQLRWIPVSESERLPTDIVLLSLPPHIDPNGEECSASVICGHYIGGKDKEWGLSDGDTCGYGIVSIRKGTNPIAWMPLPKKYEPQESEDV